MRSLPDHLRSLPRLSEETFYLLLLAGMAVASAVYITGLALSLHENFMIMPCDTAVLQNALINTLHGNWFQDTTYGQNILGLHVTLILLLLAPVYALFPSPNTLFILQACGVYSVVFPLYLIALDLLKKPMTAFLVAAAALSSPIMLHLAMAPFHPDTWIITGALWSYRFYLRNNSVGFWVSFALTVSCGEEAALIYVALGLALLFSNDGLAWRKWYGWWVLASGTAWLLLALEVVLPWMHSPGETNLIPYHYGNWGIQSALELPIALVQNPGKAIEMLLDPTRWKHLASLIGVPLLLAFTSRRSLLLMAVLPVYFLTSAQEFFPVFHAYYFSCAYLAGYFGLIFILCRRDISTHIGQSILITTLFVNFLGSLYAFENYYGGLTQQPDADFNRSLQAVFDQIPKDAGVYGPHRFADYLSARPIMVVGDLNGDGLNFNAMLQAKYPATHVRPEQIDYIVCDLINDQYGQRYERYDPTTYLSRKINIQRLINGGDWRLIFNQQHVVILQRSAEPVPDH